MVVSSSDQDELEGVANSTSRQLPSEEAVIINHSLRNKRSHNAANMEHKNKKQKRLNHDDIVNLSLSNKVRAICENL